MTTLSLDETGARMEQHVAAVLAALPDAATLEDPKSGDLACENGPPGTRTTSREDEIAGLDPARAQAHIDAVKVWWEDNGYTVLTDERKGRDGNHRFLRVQNDEDRFTLALTGNRLGRLYIAASSPCVWPDGTPAGT